MESNCQGWEPMFWKEILTCNGNFSEMKFLFLCCRKRDAIKHLGTTKDSALEGQLAWTLRVVSFRQAGVGEPRESELHSHCRQKKGWFDALGFESSKGKSIQPFVADPQREKKDSRSGSADVLAGVCMRLSPLLLLLCAWNCLFPLIKFPDQISTLLPAVSHDTWRKINLSAIPRVLHVYFHSRTCHIVLVVCLPACLLSQLDCELPKIRDFTFHLYVINVESAWHMVSVFTNTDGASQKQ